MFFSLLDVCFQLMLMAVLSYYWMQMREDCKFLLVSNLFTLGDSLRLLASDSTENGFSSFSLDETVPSHETKFMIGPSQDKKNSFAAYKTPCYKSWNMIGRMKESGIRGTMGFFFFSFFWLKNFVVIVVLHAECRDGERICPSGQEILHKPSSDYRRQAVTAISLGLTGCWRC